MPYETKHYNMKNTSQGQRAYHETRRNGGSKEEARQAASSANESYYKKIADNQMKHLGSYDGDFGDDDDGSFYPVDEDADDTDGRDCNGSYYE